MTEQEQERFDMLRQGACAPFAYINDYYALPWPLPEDMRPDFESWAHRQKRRRACGAGVSRYEIEGFLQQNGIIPRKWMAARLGMDTPSLDQLLARLKDLGMRPQRYVVYQDLIADSLSEDLVQHLPGLRFRTFSDHNSFCARLHADLAATLGIEVQALYCATSERMQDDPRQFASDFDCITLAPLCGKHQVWLNFGKPLNLAPDRCSKLFYVENREVLQPHCAGTHEPKGLEHYSQFLAAPQHG